MCKNKKYCKDPPFSVLVKKNKKKMKYVPHFVGHLIYVPHVPHMWDICGTKTRLPQDGDKFTDFWIDREQWGSEETKIEVKSVTDLQSSCKDVVLERILGELNTSFSNFSFSCCFICRFSVSRLIKRKHFPHATFLSLPMLS